MASLPSPEPSASNVCAGAGEWSSEAFLLEMSYAPSSSPTALLNASMNLSLFIVAMSNFDFAIWFMSRKKDRGVTTLHVLKNRWEWC